MLQLGRRIRSLWIDPTQQLRALLPELIELASRLQDAGRQADPLTGLVIFFNLTSSWHDRLREIKIATNALKDLNYNRRYDQVIGGLETLSTHFERGGRQRCGMNRTEPGQLVTGENVFLGGVYGTFTHPIPKWQELLAREEPECRTSCKGIINGQASKFMASHIGPMVQVITDLDRTINV